MLPDACSSVKKEQTTFAVIELCQRMSDPSQHIFSKLKRLVPYLKEEVAVFSDSDRDGDKETMKSSSEGVAFVGRHFSKAFSTKQKITARNSAEAEMFAAALRASEAEAVQRMMCDSGFALNPVLINRHRQQSTFSIDMKSAERNTSTWRIGDCKMIGSPQCQKRG